jgi:Ca2+-binding EF-hand superfamily protein
MKLKLVALTILSAVLIIPHTAQAGGHTAEIFLEADADRNGSVSREEYTVKYENKFTHIDANSDGQATGAEYEAYIDTKYKEKQVDKFKKMDTDGDGQISLEDMLEGDHSWKHKH